jgi:hypothetical protein
MDITPAENTSGPECHLLEAAPDKWPRNPRTRLLKIPCFSVASVANDLFTRIISLKQAPFHPAPLFQMFRHEIKTG